MNDSGGRETATGASSNGQPLPVGAEQTEAILAIGQRECGSRFVVQHNGLQTYQPGCANEGRHPARPPYTVRGSGCPNHWVLRAGSDGKTITGYQTLNQADINTPADVDLAMKNALLNSDAVFVELYEGPLWAAAHANTGVLPGGKTLAQWADELHDRRRRMSASAGDPFPATYRHAFTGVTASTLYYFDRSACRGAGAPLGTIVVDR